MRNSSSLDWLRFMHTPNDYRVSRHILLFWNYNQILYLPFLHLINGEDGGILLT